jgi:hypothetical protein
MSQPKLKVEKNHLMPPRIIVPAKKIASAQKRVAKSGSTRRFSLKPKRRCKECLNRTLSPPKEATHPRSYPQYCEHHYQLQKIGSILASAAPPTKQKR